jgi:diketogulonate reductase-like aldo/keto reductase
MKIVKLPCGERVPALGLGTWHMGEARSRRAEELATLQMALDMGMSLVDTAEMYGEGRAEELVGLALEGRREQAFLVSKVLPHHATREGVVAACERSLLRLRTDFLDLYLLHWPGSVPLSETIEGFKILQLSSKIRFFGVSNFDVSDMQRLWETAGGQDAQVDQVYFSLSHRAIEWDLYPWLRRHRVPVMAYSPFDEGRLLLDPRLAAFAHSAGMTPPQAAIAWLMSKDDVIAIPKASGRKKLLEDLEALQRPLNRAELDRLGALFPPPPGSQPLEMI